MMKPEFLTNLLESAESSSHKLTEQLASVRAAFEALSTELDESRAENLALTKTIELLTCENRELTVAKNRMSAERASEKETVQFWEKGLSPDYTQSEGSTQGNVATDAMLPSSPPENKGDCSVLESFEEGANDSLSQRLLPMSMEICDPTENFDGNLSELKQQNDSLKDTEPGLAGVSATQRKEAIRYEESETSHRPQQAVAQKSNEASSKVEATQLKRNDSEINDTEFHAWLEKLQSRVWHPEDFKLNSVHTPDVDNRLGFERNKLRRKCLHGIGCSDCDKFYTIGHIDGALQQGSKHRVMLDKQETPPGYWDMDFPGSSQQSVQKLSVREYLIAEGRERLHEAVRGGRYIFKDPELNQRISRHCPT